MRSNPQKTVNLVTFTEDILHEKFILLLLCDNSKYFMTTLITSTLSQDSVESFYNTSCLYDFNTSYQNERVIGNGRHTVSSNIFIVSHLLLGNMRNDRNIFLIVRGKILSEEKYFPYYQFTADT